MMYLIYHVNSKVHIIEGSSKFLDEISLFGDHRRCDNGEMFLICHMTSLDHMLKSYVSLRVEVSRDKLPFCTTYEPLV